MAITLEEAKRIVELNEIAQKFDAIRSQFKISSDTFVDSKDERGDGVNIVVGFKRFYIDAKTCTDLAEYFSKREDAVLDELKKHMNG